MPVRVGVAAGDGCVLIGSAQSTRVDVCTGVAIDESPAVTITVTPALALESGVTVVEALPSFVTVLIGFAVPSATTEKFTGVPSATLLPLASVTVTETVAEDVPLQLISAGETVAVMAFAAPTTVMSAEDVSCDGPMFRRSAEVIGSTFSIVATIVAVPVPVPPHSTWYTAIGVFGVFGFRVTCVPPTIASSGLPMPNETTVWSADGGLIEKSTGTRARIVSLASNACA